MKKYSLAVFLILVLVGTAFGREPGSKIDADQQPFFDVLYGICMNNCGTQGKEEAECSNLCEGEVMSSTNLRYDACFATCGYSDNECASECKAEENPNSISAAEAEADNN